MFMRTILGKAVFMILVRECRKVKIAGTIQDSAAIYPDRADYMGDWKNGIKHGEGVAWVRYPSNYKQILEKYNVKCDNDICRETTTGRIIPMLYGK